MKIAKALVCLTLIYTSILPAKKKPASRIEVIRQKVRAMLPTTALGGFKLGVATTALVSGAVILYLKRELTRLKIDHEKVRWLVEEFDGITTDVGGLRTGLEALLAKLMNEDELLKRLNSIQDRLNQLKFPDISALDGIIRILAK